MAAWSLAKLYEGPRQGGAPGGPCVGGPARGGRCSSRPAVVDEMLLRLASEATRRIDKFEDQGISNIAWALVTLGLAGGSAAAGRQFVETAVDFCSTELRGYSTQAVANLLWACVRVDSAREKRVRQRLGRFCSAAAEVVTERMTSASGGGLGAHAAVTWKDLASVAAALSYGRQKSPPAARFAALLAQRAAEQVSKGSLSRQEMLNISLSLSRLRVPPHEMRALVDSVAACLAMRDDQVNQLDLFQWDQVRQWCPPSSTQARACR